MLSCILIGGLINFLGIPSISVDEADSIGFPHVDIIWLMCWKYSGMYRFWYSDPKYSMRSKFEQL